MEYTLAVWLGRTAACMMDFVVFIPALIAGFTTQSWRGRAIGGLIVLGIVLAIKMPVIRRNAILLDIPDEPVWSIAFTYGGAIAILILVAAGIRALFRGKRHAV